MHDLSSKEPSRTEIWKMFDDLSGTYDRTNRLMTFGLDLYWRKKVASFLPKKENLRVLDLATGTADQLISLLKHSKNISSSAGIDLSGEMLRIGIFKVEKTPFADRIALRKGSALDIPFPQESFDCVTLSFGIRNVTDVNLCLTQILRVLKPGGRALILETSVPASSFLRFFHKIHIRKILPFIGGLVSGKKYAYKYLNKTAETFPSGEKFRSLLETAGFESAEIFPLTFGAVSIYKADKSV